MNSLSPMEQINIIARIADMKQDQYKQLLLINTLLELMIDKGLLEHEEILLKLRELDDSPSTPPSAANPIP